MSSRVKGGLVVWGIVAIVVAVPELLAAFTHNAHHGWRTISNTTGYLEARWWWADLLVVGIIAVVALHALANPPEPGGIGRDATEQRGLRRTQGGRVTFVTRTTPRRGPQEVGWGFTILYLVICLPLVVLVSWAVSTRDWGPYELEIALYLSIAAFFIVLPSIAAAGRFWTTPFASFFATMIGLRRVYPFSASVLAAGLAVLVIHLSLYPWPTRCYIGSKADQHALATATTPQQAFTIIDKAAVTKRDACFTP